MAQPILKKSRFTALKERATRIIIKIMFGLPLVSALNGCGETCLIHNDTTIPLTRPTDGKIAAYSTIEEDMKNNRLSEPVLDFINETHALATEGIPPDLKITKVTMECLEQVGIETGRISADGAAHPSGDMGVYIRENFGDAPKAAFETIAHEIGHFQPYGGSTESISRINELEQEILGLLLLADNKKDALKWAA